MSDQLPDGPDRRDRPDLAVLWGLVALVAVAVVVGGVLGVGAMLATKATGLAGGGESTADTTGRETLFLPEPSETSSEPEPYITLSEVPEPGLPSSTFSETPSKPATEITLESAQTVVGPMEPIDLSGEYRGGDGAVLRVQRFESGAWADFDVTVPVYGSSFSTYIQTGFPGQNRIRVVDTDTGEASNEVKVTIS